MGAAATASWTRNISQINAHVHQHTMNLEFQSKTFIAERSSQQDKCNVSKSHRGPAVVNSFTPWWCFFERNASEGATVVCIVIMPTGVLHVYDCTICKLTPACCKWFSPSLKAWTLHFYTMSSSFASLLYWVDCGSSWLYGNPYWNSGSWYPPIPWGYCDKVQPDLHLFSHSSW